MKIIDLKIIPFRVPKKEMDFFNDEVSKTTAVQTIIKIITDEGLEGYHLGGRLYGHKFGLSKDCQKLIETRVKPLLLGNDPFDREKFWHWFWVANFDETVISVIDMALWDLQARAFGVPVYKLLGGCRDRVKAYASSLPNMGTIDEYAEHAAECKAIGYKHYKIHPYYFWDPIKQKPDPGRPSHIEQDIEICKAVRAKVGNDMILSFDPWGTYRTYEEAIRVGRELEKLNFYWYEHPMLEYRVSTYEKLCKELKIPILSPEIVSGSIYTRADWILRGASDISRIDTLRGGITGAKKMVSICEAFGVRCELHVGGFANLQVIGATSEDISEYYERGLLGPDVDYDSPPPYLEEICDPLDSEGYVSIPQEPGMGYKIIWDYIEENRIK